MFVMYFTKYNKMIGFSQDTDHTKEKEEIPERNLEGNWALFWNIKHLCVSRAPVTEKYVSWKKYVIMYETYSLAIKNHPN